MRFSGFGFDKFVIIAVLATGSGSAFGDGGVTDAATDGRAGSAGSSGTGGGSGSGGAKGDARAATGGAVGSKDASLDALRGDASRPPDGGGKALPGTTAVTCGPLPTGEVPDADTLPQCTSVCPLGACIQANALPAGLAAQFQNCPNSTDKCMPRFLIETLGSVRFKSCQSVAGNEGRCLPKCLPFVATQSLPVPQDVCDATEACIPCFNPIDGSDNSVCHSGCDPGPQTAATVLQSCCNGTGFCIQGTELPVSDRPRLQADSCTGTGQLCAPKDPTSAFACEVLGSEPTGPSHTGGATGAGGGGPKNARDGGPGGKDGGTGAAKDEGGCGCRVAETAHENNRGALLWMAAIGTAALSRRRRVIR